MKIVVAGNGAAAWLSAAAVARSRGNDDCKVTVLDVHSSDPIQPFGLGDATLPLLQPGNDPFPDDFSAVALAGSTFSHGIAMSGWAAPGATYFQPFGQVGADLGPVSFRQLVLKLRKEGVAMRFGDYSLSAMAAQAGRFQLPGQDPRSVLSTCRHGLHADMARLGELAKTRAKALGVSEAGILGSIERAEDGTIMALATREGKRVTADLYIDCSGPDACLTDRESPFGWEDWSAFLPCDRVMSASAETSEAPLPYSHAEANTAGWVQYLPLQGKTVLNAVFSSAHASDEDILQIFQGFFGPGNCPQTKSIPVAFGRRLQPWQGNCIALGAAAAVIDPVGVSNLHLLKTGLARLLTLLPGQADSRIMAAEYNRQAAAELSHARDFAQLHYRLNGRNGEPFWDVMRKAAVSASLGYKLQMYANLGRVAMYDFEPLEDSNWVNLFDEHGVQPRQLHPISDGIGADDLKKHAERIRAVMMDALRKMPLHADFITGVREHFTETQTGKN